MGVLGVAVAVAVPLAPVIGQSTVVQWPQAGQPPRSSTAFFVPYRPAELHATVPCAALRAALASPGRTTVLSTTGPPAAGLPVIGSGGRTGLVIESSDEGLLVATDGQRVPVALPPTRCDLGVDADSAGTTVSVAGSEVIRLPGARVPEVFAFDTDLDADVAAGMGVTARTPYWFASTPTGWKYGLLVAHAVLVALALVLLACHRRSASPVQLHGSRLSRRSRTRAEVPSADAPRTGSPRTGILWKDILWTDIAVVTVLAGWAVIGPLTDDDGFAAMIARNAAAAGDTGNYYRWFNASEAPFALVQHVVRVFAEISIAPLWLRVPSVLAGALTWLVLHRGVLPLALGRTTRTRLLAPVAAVCFLAWWLPYGLGTRPEPFVALGVTLVLALTLAATVRAVRRPLLALGLAALVAAVTAAMAPTGLLAAVPVALGAPALWRLLREGSGGAGGVAAIGARGEVAAKVALLGGVAAAVITIMFADQSWHGVVVATDIHRHIGPNLPWFDEDQRYAFLLGADSAGSAGKRLPVLLTLALMAPMLAVLARHGRALLERPEQWVLLAGAPAGLLLLAVTPSKWSHHFGALTGLGAAFLVAAVAVGITAAGQCRDRVTVAIGLGGGILVALAAALSFAGPNTWWAYSDFGMPLGDGPIRPLHSPLLWLALLGAGGVAAARRQRRAITAPARDSASSRLTALRGAADAWVAAPVLLATLAAAISVTLLLATFVAAPLRRGDGYSLPAQNLTDLTRAGCGIEEHVQVLQDLPDGALQPAEGTWSTLPSLPADQELAVSVAGRLGGGNTVGLEFGRVATGGAVDPLGRYLLRDPEPAERAYAADATARRRQDRWQRDRELERVARSWRIRTVAPSEIPPGADRVRVVVVDGPVGALPGVAATGLRRVSIVGLRDFLDSQAPVLVEWPIAFVVPCRRDVPVVAGGLAEAPAAVLGVPVHPHSVTDPWTNDSARLGYETADGASFAGVRLLGQVHMVDTRLVGDEGRDWGRVQLIDYGRARDAYDTHTVHRWLPGWAGDDGYRFD